MTEADIKNMAASVRARLANIAKAEQRPFDSRVSAPLGLFLHFALCI